MKGVLRELGMRGISGGLREGRAADRGFFEGILKACGSLREGMGVCGKAPAEKGGGARAGGGG